MQKKSNNSFNNKKILNLIHNSLVNQTSAAPNHSTTSINVFRLLKG